MEEPTEVEPLYEAIAMERSRLFVGRESELEAVCQWLADPGAPTWIMSVTGMGGVGKSTLLLRIQELARIRGISTIWVDGRACGRTPSGFLAYLSAVLDPKHRFSADGAGIAAFVPSPTQRTLWCIDNFEELEPIVGWLRERFFATFPSIGQLVVTASRQHLVVRWRDDPGWKRWLRHYPLEPLSRSESREYLGRAGVEDTAINDLVRRTGGLPLALSLAADAIERHPEAIGQEGKELLLSVNARLLRETAGSELKPVLDLLAVVPEADPRLISEVLGERLPPERLASLARLSFVQSSRLGFRLHDVARQYLLAELRELDIDHFRRLRRLAVLTLLRRLESAPPREAASHAGTLLAVCSDALPSAEGYANLSSLPSATARAARIEDLPALHRLLSAWGSQPFVLSQPKAYNQLLDRVVLDFPETCRVLIAPDGHVLGMLAAVLLWRATLQCIEAIEPGAIARHLPKEHKRISTLSHEDADTYMAAIVGADLYNEEYSMADIIGALIRDGLARLGEGTRALLGTSRPDLAQLLTHLGFRVYKKGPQNLSYEGIRYTVYELDLRSGHFGPWVMSFLNTVDGQVGTFVRAQAFSVADLRTLLADFNDAAVWERSPVPAALGLEPGVLRSRLKAALNQETPLPPPLEQVDREVLAQTFILRRAAERVAAELHVSRATYYRHLMRALNRLREALINEAG